MLTTSFPLSPDSVSGLFIKQLIAHLPKSIETTVITPCSTAPPTGPTHERFKLHCFRYAPFRWQRLAQQPGGIPVALHRHKLLYLLVPSFFAAMFFVCLRVAKRSDVIHANWSANGVIAGLAGLLTRTAVVTTLRGEDVNRLQTSRLSALTLYACLRLSRRTVTVSDALRNILINRFPGQADKLITIPNGVHERFLNLRPKGGRRRINILTVGSLIPRKGIDQILHALRRMPKGAGFMLTIVGDGPERSKLESLTSALNLGAKIRFAGTVSFDQLPAYLERADIFVLASHREGRPNVILEAMAAGLAIVSTRIEGTAELIKDQETGLLFEPGRSDQLAQKIVMLMNDPALRARLGASARAFILANRLSWHETARRYARLYYELARSRGRA